MASTECQSLEVKALFSKCIVLHVSKEQSLLYFYCTFPLQSWKSQTRLYGSGGPEDPFSFYIGLLSKGPRDGFSQS